MCNNQSGQILFTIDYHNNNSVQKTRPLTNCFDRLSTVHSAVYGLSHICDVLTPVTVVKPMCLLLKRRLRYSAIRRLEKSLVRTATYSLSLNFQATAQDWTISAVVCSHFIQCLLSLHFCLNFLPFISFIFIYFNYFIHIICFASIHCQAPPSLSRSMWSKKFSRLTDLGFATSLQFLVR